MTESQDPSDSNSSNGRPSKAALRREAFASVRATVMRSRGDEPTSAVEEDQGESVAARPDYAGAMQAYREQQRAKARQRSLVSISWKPIGPSGVRQGQAIGRPVISGRVSSMAIAPGGSRIYVGAANGGVWRSEDRGETWTPLMEAFDLNPQTTASDSQAVGALALVPGDTADEDILYVGSGEAIDGGANPTSNVMFGVGPIVSTDGGQNWQTELPGPGGPWSNLMGNGFYELALDPDDPTRVLAGTLTGLFRREPAPLSTGIYRWRHVSMPGLSPTTPVTSIVSARAPGDTTISYAGANDGPVFRSSDGGETWNEIGTGLPPDLGRIRLAVDSASPDVVYMFAEDFALYRLDVADGRWRLIRRLSTGVGGSSMPQATNVNGRWNLALAVAPGNVNRVYIGGGASGADADGWLNTQIENYGATLFRCDIDVSTDTTGTVLSITNSLHYIGASVHPDVHAIVFPPANSDEMWVGCDGGVFFTDNPPGDDGGLIPSPNGSPPRFYFQAKNTGLQTLMMHHLGQHPSEEAVVFGGTQDNGCLRFTGEAAWLHAQSGDCGFVLVNWQNPYKVLAGLQFQGGNNPRPLMVRSNFGGNLGSFRTLEDRPSNVDIATLFYYPLAGTPPGSSEPNLVAFGSTQVWISENFGLDWRTVPTGDPASDTLAGPIRAIAFASANRFYVGTHSDAAGFPDMGIYSFDRLGSTFLPTRLNPIIANPFSSNLPFDSTVSDIAIDWADATGNSIYVAFGGFGGQGHVWHANGSQWTRRDGGSPGQSGSLLDISHNAVVVDPENPQTIFAAADIGVWRSQDSGQNWFPFSEGLPDAAVIDLKLHANRQLRAATHGRGVFERPLNADAVHHIELYIRDTTLDLGRRRTEDGLDNPLQKYTQVWHWQGPDIKLDFPNRQGSFQFAPASTPDFVEFTDELRDDGLGLGNTLEDGDEHHVYAQIHNRGETAANGVQVMALITPATTGLPPLPSDYESRVQQGLEISNANWETLGFTTLNGVSARTPQIAHFVIPSDKMPPPSDSEGSFAYSVLILVHHGQDVYPLTLLQQGGVPQIPPVDVICTTRRLAAIRSVTQQRLELDLEFYEMGPASPIPFSLNGTFGRPDCWRLRFRLLGQPGRLWLFSPKLKLVKDWLELSSGFKPSRDISDFVRWSKTYTEKLEKRLESKYAHRGWTKQRIRACQQIAEAGWALEAVEGEMVFDGIKTEEKDQYIFFLHLDVPKKLRQRRKKYEVQILLERKTEKGNYEVAGGQRVLLRHEKSK